MSYQNYEGYKDPTAGKAIARAIKAQKTRVLHYDLKHGLVKCPSCGGDLTRYVKDRFRFCPWCTQRLN